MNSSLENLFWRLHPRLTGVLHEFEIRPDDAENLLHETLLIYLYKRHRISAPELWMPAMLAELCRRYALRQQEIEEILSRSLGKSPSHGERRESPGVVDPPGSSGAISRGTLGRMGARLRRVGRQLASLASLASQAGHRTRRCLRRRGYTSKTGTGGGRE